jgi:2,3-bisphosphoglycerate-independent phosphoglycerate mutase
MKIAVLLGDGMAGLPLADHGGRTSLERARHPNLDRMARMGTLGTASTVPEGYPPGSDVANLSVFGYNPAGCYTGRAPLEAAAMGVTLGPADVAYRMNLVHLLASYTEVFMDDFTAGHISPAEAGRIVLTLNRELGGEGIEFHPGVGYRNLMVWRGGEDRARTVPPHDITGKAIQSHLPTGPGADTLVGLMTGSQILLKDHPVNVERRGTAKKEANSIWLWGQGKAPKIPTYAEKYGLAGAVISAVDLIRGIGVLAGLATPKVAGATGYLDTDYEGKVRAALDALRTSDFVYVHVEAPDETAHQGLADEKVRAIEDFDAKVVGPVWEALEASGEEYAILAMPDHPTPVAMRTHTGDPVPFVHYRKGQSPLCAGDAYTEASARATGLAVGEAHRLMDHMTGKVALW